MERKSSWQTAASFPSHRLVPRFLYQNIMVQILWYIFSTNFFVPKYYGTIFLVQIYLPHEERIARSGFVGFPPEWPKGNGALVKMRDK